MQRPVDASTRPLIIGGMHRSGTSLTASLFAGAGLDLGPELLGANESNPMGHFEDLGFFTFHRRALLAQGVCDEGYTANGPIEVPIALEAEANDLLAARMRPGVAWGWKEPRTTLFLDFWQERLPEARHVFVFRRPWEVADSLFRRGDETFSLNPTFALDVWTHYNHLILDFVRRHRSNCLVFEITQVVADPDAVCDAVQTRLGVPLARPTERYRPELFTRDGGSTHAAIVRAVAPDAWRIYEELRELAGGDAATDGAAWRERSPGECAVVEWARASRADSRASQASRCLAELETAECTRAARDQAERDQAEQARAEQERAAREARRKPLARVARGLRRASATMLHLIQAAATRLLSRPGREGAVPTPDLLPFPRPAAAPAKRAA